MATRDRTEKKEDKPVASKAQADSLAATVRKIVKALEVTFGIDIDGDKSVGKARIGLLASLAVCILCYTAFAANQWSLERPENAALNTIEVDSSGDLTIIADEANDATLVLDADQGDDTADTWTIEAEASGNDLSVMNGATEVLNLTSAGNLQVDGTLTASGLLDSDTTGVTGSFTVATNLTVSGDIVDPNLAGTITIAVSEESDEITIAQTNAAGTAATPLIAINDDRTGATANTAAEATITIDAEGTHAIGVLDGIVAVESILDTYAAGALLLGSATATSVEIADASVATDIQGTLSVDEAAVFDTTVAINGATTIGDASNDVTTVNSLEIRCVNLPTSTNGFTTSGTLWNDSGTLKVH